MLSPPLPTSIPNSIILSYSPFIFLIYTPKFFLDPLLPSLFPRSMLCIVQLFRNSCLFLCHHHGCEDPCYVFYIYLVTFGYSFKSIFSITTKFIELQVYAIDNTCHFKLHFLLRTNLFFHEILDWCGLEHSWCLDKGSFWNILKFKLTFMHLNV